MLVLQIFCIVLIAQVQATAQTCAKLMSKLIIEYNIGGAPVVMKEVSPYLALSGLGVNKWGDYDACLRKGWDYSSVQLLLGPLGYNFFGICHSQQCTDKDLNSNLVKNQVKHIIDESGVLDELGITIDQVDYTFVEPFNQKMDFMTGFTIFIICCLIVLCFALSAIQLMTDFKTRKQRYQIMYSQAINKSTINDTDQGTDIVITNENAKVNLEKDSSSIKLLKDFSIQENWNQLLKLNTPDPNLQMFTGIRALAFMMVVYGHQYFILAGLTYKTELLLVTQKLMFTWLLDMLYAVDIFFWIGGFFVGFILFESKKLVPIKNSPFSLLMILLHRLLRLWPCYIIWMLINCNIFPYMLGGPRAFEGSSTFFGETWWRNVLFIDNLFTDFRYVMGWGWYMSNDIQMFVAGLFALVIYAHNPTFGKIAILVLLFATQLTGTLLTFLGNYLLPCFSLSNPDAYLDYYIKPWARGPPYYLGLIYGVLYREFKSNSEGSLFGKYKSWMNLQSQRKIITQIVFYSSGLGLLGTLMFAYNKAQKGGPEFWPEWFQNLWNSFCRLLFTFGLSLLVFPGIVGVRDTFNSLMNNLLFRFLAKLSFTGYLCHYSFILLNSVNFYETPEFSTSSIMQFLLGNLLLTIVFATLLTLMVEMPFAKLEQRLMVSLAGSKQRARSLESPDMSDKLLKK